MPAPPPPPPPLPDPPKRTDAAVKKARDDERSRAALASGRDGTIATNPLGLSGGAGVKKILLGA
jgi:hypothetical protein